MYIYIFMCVCIYIYTYVYIYTHIRTIYPRLGDPAVYHQADKKMTSGGYILIHC